MVINETFTRDMLRLFVWYPLRWLVLVMPIKHGFFVFRRMGDIHYMVSRGKSRVLGRNLKLAFPERNDNSISSDVRGYFRNHYVNQLQIFLFPKFTEGNIERFHTFEGLENLDEALKNGKGCILLHPHFGPAQMPLHALGLKGYPMMQLGLPTDEGLSFIGRKVAFRLRVKYENMIAGKIISADSFLRPIMRWLKDNKVLMMTGDGAGKGKFIGKFIPVGFLGRTILFPVGSVVLASKTGASLLPMFTVPGENNTYKTIIHKPMQDEVDGMIYEAVSGFAKLFDGYIRNYPYFWHFFDEFDERCKKGRLHKDEMIVPGCMDDAFEFKTKNITYG